MTRIVFVTGQPGIGKTTVLLNAIETLKKKGHRIGGMISREVRQSGVRIGFEIIDIHTKQKGWLAHVNQPTGPRVGKYRVNLEDLKLIGARSIAGALARADIIVIDEIGPMELFSPAFKRSVIQALESNKQILGTIHHSAHSQLVSSIKTRNDTEILKITCENRTSIRNLIIDKTLQSLSQKPSSL